MKTTNHIDGTLEYRLPPLTEQQRRCGAAMKVVRPAHQTAYFQNRDSLRTFLQRDFDRLGQSTEQLAQSAHVSVDDLEQLIATGKGTEDTIRRVFDAMNVTALVIPTDSLDAQ